MAVRMSIGWERKTGKIIIRLDGPNEHRITQLTPAELDMAALRADMTGDVQKAELFRQIARIASETAVGAAADFSSLATAGLMDVETGTAHSLDEWLNHK